VPFANSYELLAELEEEEFKVEHLVFPISLSTSNGVIVTPALFDCGCSSNIIDDKFASEHELPRIPRDVPVGVETVDGSPMGTGTIVEKVPTKMKIGDHEEITSFNVSTSGYYKVILGISWMARHNPTINYVNGTMTFDSEFCKKNCLHGDNITTTAIPAKEAGRRTSTKKIHCTTRTQTLREPQGHPEKVQEPFLMRVNAATMKRILREPTETAFITNYWFINAARRTNYQLAREQNLAEKKEEKVDWRKITPKEYHDFADIFDKEKADQLPPHRPEFDHKIELEDGSKPPFGPIYSLTPAELEEVNRYLNENLSKG